MLKLNWSLLIPFLISVLSFFLFGLIEAEMLSTGIFQDSLIYIIGGYVSLFLGVFLLAVHLFKQS
jgi:hypothetical protein